MTSRNIAQRLRNNESSEEEEEEEANDSPMTHYLVTHLLDDDDDVSIKATCVWLRDYTYCVTHVSNCPCGSVGNASDTQAVGHGFEPRQPDH